MKLINDALLAFIAILPVVNPFSTPPIFISITDGLSADERKKQAIKACLYAFLILLVSLLAGTFILKFFSISLPAVQIAGGLLIARTGFQMLAPRREHHQTPAEEKEACEKEDVSFIPLAMPLLSGPGAMAVVINLATGVRLWTGWLAISAAAAGVCVITALAGYATPNHDDRTVTPSSASPKAFQFRIRKARTIRRIPKTIA